MIQENGVGKIFVPNSLAVSGLSVKTTHWPPIAKIVRVSVNMIILLKGLNGTFHIITIPFISPGCNLFLDRLQDNTINSTKQRTYGKI